MYLSRMPEPPARTGEFARVTQVTVPGGTFSAYSFVTGSKNLQNTTPVRYTAAET